MPNRPCRRTPGFIASRFIASRFIASRFIAAVPVTIAASILSIALGACTSSPRSTNPPTPTTTTATTPTDPMVRIDGGTFLMGAGGMYEEEPAPRKVTVASFWIDTHEVTNAQFKRFVDATGYVTLAERAPSATDYPDADPSLLVAGSAVFSMPDPADSASASPTPPTDMSWWAYVPGACWRHPTGPGSSIDARMDHPVVHIAYEDAVAYATWCGKRLPTEEEWEYAARGGLVAKTYAWGDELTPNGRFMANTWQGQFPSQNTAADGFVLVAPVGRFPANGFGVYDMIGNVWEWTATQVPTGEHITKGGSFLCAPSYCQRYRPAARFPVTNDTTTSHIGFRCVRSAE